MKARGLGRVYLRGGVWWVQFSFRGRKYRESTGSTKRADAVKLLRRRQGEMGRGVLVGPSAERVTFADLARMVEEDYQLRGRRSKPPLGRLREHFPPHTRALDITRDVVGRYIKARLAEGASPQTVKHEVGILGRAFSLAVDAGHLAVRPRFPMPRVSNTRTGFFTDAEVRALLPHLPDYLRPIIEAAWLTGWRRGELLALRWSQVDWESGTLRLERGTTKSGEPRSFPFTAHPRLAELLRERREETSRVERERGTVCPWVFHRNGEQVRGWYYDGWRTACAKAGIPGRLVHDLRRSAARNLVRAGVSERVAMTLTGHLTRSIFDRYHIVSSSDQVEAVRKLAELHGARESEPQVRRVVALGDAVAERTGTVRAQSGRTRATSRVQVTAALRRSLASPTGFEPVLQP